MNIVNADKLKEVLECEIETLWGYYDTLKQETEDDKRHAQRVRGKIRGLKLAIVELEMLQVKL